MPINFFDDAHKSSASKELFGLCDDNSTPDTHQQPAYLSEDLAAKDTEWIAEVVNSTKQNVDFYPIDNCVCITRPDGTEESKCDCMLHHDINCVIFIELKERHGRAFQWKKDAEDQLKNTILHFKKNHTTDNYKSIKAHICNRLRPAAATPSPQMQQQFKDETGCVLYIGRRVNI